MIKTCLIINHDHMPDIQDMARLVHALRTAGGTHPRVLADTIESALPGVRVVAQDMGRGWTTPNDDHLTFQWEKRND